MLGTYYVELKQDCSIRTAFSSFELKSGIYRVNEVASRIDDDKSNVTNLLNSMPARLSVNADRIWRETDEKVEYVKNRFDHNNVDMEEFTWIKLSAKDLQTR